MNPELTQPSLLSRVRDPANEGAWREFEGKYRELVLRFCRARGMGHMDSEDVLQTVMTALIKSLPQFTYDPQRGRFRDYLYRCVRNAITQQAARPKHAARSLDTSMMAAIGANDEAALERLWTQEWVNHHYRMALDTVHTSFEPRSVDMFERSIRGESVESLAAAFDTTTQAVHKVRQRIRARMEELISQQVREEDAVDE